MRTAVRLANGSFSALLMAMLAPPHEAPVRAVAGNVTAQQVDFALSGEPTQGGWLRGTLPRGSKSLKLDGRDIQVAEDGGFLIAFDRDASAQAMLTAIDPNGREIRKSLTIAPRQWQLVQLRNEDGAAEIQLFPQPNPKIEGELSPKSASELAILNAARASVSDSAGWRQTFIWPLQGKITRHFGRQEFSGLSPRRYYSGTSVAAKYGTPIVAPADGVVVLVSEWKVGWAGRMLMLDHGMGVTSLLAHCSELLVKEGETVRQGQVIARSGSTGRATGPVLFWSMAWHGSSLDPELFAGPMTDGTS